MTKIVLKEKERRKITKYKTANLKHKKKNNNTSKQDRKKKTEKKKQTN